MSDFLTLSAVSAGELFRAEKIQEWWFNLDILKNPLMAKQGNPGPPATASWSYSSITVWADIDPVYYHIDFESGGNPLLIWAQMRTSHSVLGGQLSLTFMVDGVRLGNTAGLFFASNFANVPVTDMIAHIITAGEGGHTLSVQIINNTTGNAFISNDAALGIFVMEF